MAVGEIILTAFFQVLLERLGSSEFLKFVGQLHDGFDSELKKWEKNLKMIQAVLNDAEDKQMTDKAIELWLDELQDLAYDAEDVLDEFATEALKSKGQNIMLSSFNFKFIAGMRSKILDISSRLEQLYEQKFKLGLQLTPGGTSSSADALRRPPSSSVPTDRVLYGRDEDKENILKLVLSDEPNDANFLVIPIIGMAGIGKTTLAREVYNDKKVEDFKFDIKAWVCVSDVFDVLGISKALLESINSVACNLNTLNEVQVQLKKVVDGKKILLVLDDVWNQNYSKWEDLKAPFLSFAPKSKIIVTTRHEEVASVMGSAKDYNLKLLSGDDCWSMFLNHTVQGRVINADRISEFRDKIVRKCGGLPLAAKTLGGLLRTKRNDDWDGILNSSISDFSDENDILPVLKLSYHYLPSHLKRCFAYCAIFPKDYEFEKEELVLLWIAEGVIKQPRDNQQLEDFGSDCFDDLVSRSIFQQSNNDGSKFIMHDLVHDLAELVSRETIFRLENANKLPRNFQRIRHSSYTRDWCDGKNKFEVFSKFEYVRTFLPVARRVGCSWGYISYIILSDLLPKFKKLRVLSLHGYHIPQLPFSFKDLCLLTYLDLTGSHIRNLPKSTNSLLNLQILILRDCKFLIKLPAKLRNLINLRHLVIEGATLLKEMPRGMEKLKSLQTLSNFIVSKGGKVSHLKDLKILNLLCGELRISGLENLNDSRDAREGRLSEKKNLQALMLEWEPQFDTSRDEVVEENVLDLLQPHENIKRLTIKYYGGARFPLWVGNRSFCKMEILTLESCTNCESLPSLGLLTSLKHLNIRGLMKLKRINSEFFGKGCSKPFQSLEALCLENLPELEYWDTNVSENDVVEIFPCLRELSIVRCAKLYGNLPNVLPSLKKLVVSKCVELVVPVSSFSMLCKLEIDNCKGIVCSSTPIDSKLIKCATISNNTLDVEGCKGMLCNSRTEMKSLTISNIFDFATLLDHGVQVIDNLAIGLSEQVKNWREYGTFYENPVQGLHVLIDREEVSIEENSISLVSFPQITFLHNNLQSLTIENSRALKSIPEEMMGNNSQLKRLKIVNCNSLTFIAKGKLPASLESARIRSCENLVCLVDDEEDASTSSWSSSSVMLKSLDIYDCPEITTLFSRIHSLEALQSLQVNNCPKLQSLPDGLHNLNYLQSIWLLRCPSFIYFPERGLPSTISNVFIESCKNLKALPTDIHKLTSLRILAIRDCPSIVSFPEEGFPTSLTALAIDDLKFYKALIQWGLHRLTSLTSLHIAKCDDNAEFFPDKGIGMMLPNSLTHLEIVGYQKLKSLSSTGFESLASLEKLLLWNCPMLKSFTEFGLPSSLLQLYIRDCPLLKKQCKRDKGKEWSNIAHIPCVKIDGKFIYDPQKEE